ncbi:MAG: valine--tRNA ligase [Deltaproteobacteria bacterium]|jgi:valyl-tRNA synthetase|nr:valine--tRNA ligase [Deltaproteobacteria bacterium]
MRLNDPLDKNFDFNAAESRLYSDWENRGLFIADPKKPGPKFVIVIPPPNVTGNLHMGHALDVTLQDILTRYRRMKGDNALWLPGTDHAGIATQSVVERNLAEKGVTRHDLGREKFVEKVWEWKKAYGGNIVQQLRRLGASCDWSRERFTMDPGLSKAVREVFVSLYEENLIYQGEYIINWCPRCHTAVSDIEVEHQNKSDHLYYLRYWADDLPPLIVATTRPETCFGDAAVAVNPADPRFSAYKGRQVRIPLTDRLIPVIEDDYADMEFGTGALKVTPAHDPNDFHIGRRHDLPVVVAIDENGQLTDAAGSYEGLDRFEARQKMLTELEEKGLLEKVEPLEHSVGVCYRCRTVIEPFISKQWFVRTASLAAEAAAAVRDGRTKLVPATWEKTYFDWMDNIRDWCISRQLWWGHQIPAWRCVSCEATTVSREDPAACPKCGGELIQDPDVLDTWFSSALWPFSTLGWPEKTEDLARYFPTSVLVTGFDIIFFWVARMMMMGLKMMGEVPFEHVVLHPLVRDVHGQKMSKSKGNVIDPLLIIDKYGADSFRFSLAAQAGQARDLRIDEKRIQGYSKFVNKIWNAARFVLSAVKSDVTATAGAAVQAETVPDRWIRSRMNEVTAQGRAHLEEFHFDRYCDLIYQFTWYEFCDWYLELIKPILYGQDEAAKDKTAGVLTKTFAELLKLIHPVMPFVTEELWSKFSDDGSFIMTSSFPEANDAAKDPEAERLVSRLMDVTKAVRQVRSDFGLPPSVKLSPMVMTEDADTRALLESQGPLLLKLMGADQLTLAGGEEERSKDSASSVLDWGQVWTPLAGHINPSAEIKRLSKEIDKLNADVKAAETKLASEEYTSKAPEDVVAETRERLEAMRQRTIALSRALDLVSLLSNG